MEIVTVETPDGMWRSHAGMIEESLIEHFEPLMSQARTARQRAYAPYSGFHVGAAVLLGENSYAGCNVENASYGGTICAERTAICSGVAAGDRELQIVAVSTDAQGSAEISDRSPCGICRQFLSEFAIPGALVLLDAGSEGETTFSGEVLAFADLLPHRFRLDRHSP